MKTFKTKRAMMMAAKRLEAALNERLKMFCEPATAEIDEVGNTSVHVECSNRNTYALTLIEVNEMVDVANEFFKDYDTNNWHIKFDTTPVYNSSLSSFFHIPTLVIVLVSDDIKKNKAMTSLFNIL